MVWSLDDKPILTISNHTGVLPSVNPHVTAEPLIPGSLRRGWVFSLNTTEVQDQARVTCDLLNIQRESASLFVQEKGSVELLGGDRLAFKDQSVVFECRAAGWRPAPSLEWQVGKEQVSSGGYNLSIQASGRGLFTATSSLQVVATRSSQVTCSASVSAMDELERGRVHLTVVTEVQEDNCTVPLAVTASLLAILLLLLLVGGGAALWFRRRTRARSSSQQGTGLGPPSGTGRSASKDSAGWRVNAGFSSEEPTDAVKNEKNMGSGCQTDSQMDSVGIGEVPDVVSSSNLSLHHDSLAQSSLENSSSVRRITTV
ncbi:uncharacterized protein igsf5b [Nelusetta ayraudi]|uniref:uncharacterized protein igsf5b n=1 Tax=Nelusetta ayraudi TaxID=303726 RepID=UPI003F713E62